MAKFVLTSPFTNKWEPPDVSFPLHNLSEWFGSEMAESKHQLCEYFLQSNSENLPDSPGNFLIERPLDILQLGCLRLSIYMDQYPRQLGSANEKHSLIIYGMWLWFWCDYKSQHGSDRRAFASAVRSAEGEKLNFQWKYLKGMNMNEIYCINWAQTTLKLCRLNCIYVTSQHSQ